MFEKALWRTKFGAMPTWPCPACESIALGRRKGSDGFRIEETGPSKRARSHEEWDPEWIEQRFAAILQCHNPACGELVAVCGNVSVEEYYIYDENGEHDYIRGDIYYPTYFEKAPPIFKIHSKCPDAVKAHLVAAFSLIWCDLGAAANRLRAGVEALLDDQGVAKTYIYNRRRRPLSAHNRIEKFRVKDREAADYLMAIKWLGNEGSHGAAEDVSRDDLLNAMELFEAAVDRVFVKSADKFAKLAAGISRRKGKKEKAKRKRKK
jgi:hypothetical protein